MIDKIVTALNNKIDGTQVNVDVQITAELSTKVGDVTSVPIEQIPLCNANRTMVRDSKGTVGLVTGKVDTGGVVTANVTTMVAGRTYGKLTADSKTFDGSEDVTITDVLDNREQAAKEYTDTEKAARIAADTALSANLSQAITNEQSAREAADDAIDAHLTSATTTLNAQKADKDLSALEGGIAQFDSNFNPTYQGAKITDFAPASITQIAESAVQDPYYVHTDNNYTTSEKDKLAGIADNANNYTLPADVVHDADYVHTDNNYTTAEKTKLGNIADGANNYVLPTDVVHDANYVHTDNNFTNDIKDRVLGAKTGFTFNNTAALDAWITNTASGTPDPTNAPIGNPDLLVTDLIVGEDLYTLPNDEPDYWWTGEGRQTLVTEKVDLSGYVQTTRKVNGKELSADITLSASDVNALPNTTTVAGNVISGTNIPLKKLTIQKNGAEVGTFNSSSDAVINVIVPTGALASKNTISNIDVASDAEIAQSKISGLTSALGSKVSIGTSAPNTVYGQDASGYQTRYSISSGETANTVVKTDNVGLITVQTPSLPANPTTKAYVDAVDNKKLNAIIAAPDNTVSDSYVYANIYNPNASTSSPRFISASTGSADVGTIVQRSTNGHILDAAMPTSSIQLANKEYVDIEVGKKANFNDVVDLTSAQTVTGIKTFSPGTTVKSLANSSPVNSSGLFVSNANEDGSGILIMSGSGNNGVFSMPTSAGVQQNLILGVKKGAGGQGEPRYTVRVAPPTNSPSVGTARLINLAAPEEATDAANKQYVDTAVANVPAPSNMVTTDTAQTISATKTFSSQPVFSASNGIKVRGTTVTSGSTTDYTATLPNKTGTVAMTDDIVPPVFDKVIRTQADFNALVSSSTWLGAVSVAFVGSFVYGESAKGGVQSTTGVRIPQTVKQIQGFNGATITVTNFTYGATTARGGLWYATAPTTDDYSIKDLAVSCTGTGAGYGFSGCTQLTNCTGSGTSTGTGAGYGFSGCTQLTNCTGSGTSAGGTASGFSSCTQLTNCIIGELSSTGTSYGFNGCIQLINCMSIGGRYSFYTCTQLINCTGTSTYSGSTACLGFNNCTQLTNCTGSGTNTGTGAGYGFNGCTQLTNCTGSGTSAGTGAGYGFNGCSFANGCKAGSTASTTALWGGTNTKCPTVTNETNSNGTIPGSV